MKQQTKSIFSKDRFFVLSGEFTDLNTYINAERTNRFKAAKIKKLETTGVFWQLQERKVTALDTPCMIGWNWYTKDSRKDSDNVFFAKKWILDGMVLAGILPDDSYKYVMGTLFENRFIDKKNPRVEIFVRRATDG